MTVYRYCPACGSRLDDDGICTSTTCPRRALQLALKEKQEAANAVKEAQKKTAEPVEATNVGNAD